MKILVTGGTGYIGSHIVVELLSRGDEVVIIDNLSNSDITVLDRIAQITSVRPSFYKLDLCDLDGLSYIFSIHKFDVVIHLAGKKAVGESVEKPQEYYYVNLIATLNLASCMQQFEVKNLVFSSSATVYSPSKTPVDEQANLGCTNPYGYTKLFNEQILIDICKANKSLNVAILRYFNPLGAHSSGLIGECPIDTPNNLAPYVLAVAGRQLPYVRVFGNDYSTPDGTGVRDYIHVCDLAKGHIKVIDKLLTNCGCVIYNLGTGKGYSVLEVIDAYRVATKADIPYQFLPRRPGDIDSVYAVADKARRELGFTAERTLLDMAKDSWKWYQYYLAHINKTKN
ncbi:MAG: UDP-glucose 4-epimerase GalE [Clostridia bacterium]